MKVEYQRHSGESIVDRLNFTPAGRRYQDVTNRCFAKNDDALMILQ